MTITVLYYIGLSIGIGTFIYINVSFTVYDLEIFDDSLVEYPIARPFRTPHQDPLFHRPAHYRPVDYSRITTNIPLWLSRFYKGAEKKNIIYKAITASCHYSIIISIDQANGINTNNNY